jgi:hypothetical protein
MTKKKMSPPQFDYGGCAWLPKLPWQFKVPMESEEAALRRELEQISYRLQHPEPPTNVEASSLRIEAEQIKRALELLRRSTGRRGKSEFAFKKRLREAQEKFIITLGLYGLDFYTRPDGFSVRVLPPREESRVGSFRSRVVFDS